MTKKMYIIVGISGSGKSYCANEIRAKDSENTVILSADTCFNDSHGKYLWAADGLKQAHQLNQIKCRVACEREISTIIIDNTNLRAWERENYEKLAKKFGYTLEYVEPNTSWKDDPVECAKRSTHLDDVEITKRQLQNKEMP